MKAWLKNCLASLCRSPEENFLSAAIDTADFERRLKLIENPRNRQDLYFTHYYGH
jgi:hypothetical protein